jgi:hypothetical protein
MGDRGGGGGGSERLRALDLRRCLRYVDLEREWHRPASLAPAVTTEQARRAMHVMGPDGQVHRGFFAFRELARVLPPLWPLLPLFHAPFGDGRALRLQPGGGEPRPCRLPRGDVPGLSGMQISVEASPAGPHPCGRERARG